MVSLAAQDAADHHDDAGAGADAPGGAHRIDPFGFDPGRVEPSNVDMGGNDDDAVGGDPMALGDDVRDLIAHGDHLLAARHHAVIGVLEQVLVAKSPVPGGEEGNPGHAGGGIAAPSGRPRECVHHPAMALADEPRQHECIAGDDDRIDACHVEAHELGAAGRHIALEPAAAGNHHGTVPGAR